MRHSLPPEGGIPSDLHVLGLPLAFILSQDQTLHCKVFFNGLKPFLVPSLVLINGQKPVIDRRVVLQYFNELFLCAQGKTPLERLVSDLLPNFSVQISGEFFYQTTKFKKEFLIFKRENFGIITEPSLMI